MLPSRPIIPDTLPVHATRPIRVAILEPNEILSAGYRVLFPRWPDLDLVGVWSRPEAALAEAPALQPDVFLIDMHIGVRAFDFLREILTVSPHTHLIVMMDCLEQDCMMLRPSAALTGLRPPCRFSPCPHAPDDCLQAALKLGARGAMRKPETFQKIVDAIRTVYQGQFYLEPSTAARLAGQYLQQLRPDSVGLPEGFALLTERERAVVELIAQGLSNKEIAQALHVAYSTVKHHVSSILAKLGLSDRTQIALSVVAAAPPEARPQK
jgi:DNA-binding NarL/FixJ family response regulator